MKKKMIDLYEKYLSLDIDTKSIEVFTKTRNLTFISNFQPLRKSSLKYLKRMLKKKGHSLRKSKLIKSEYKKAPKKNRMKKNLIIFSFNRMK